jgi:hypothetical protein
MPSEWAAVESLIRDLGSIRSAADAAHASDIARAAIEQSIREATDAVLATVQAPHDPSAFTEAHEAIAVAREVIGAFDVEMERSVRLRAGAQNLRARAQELIRGARENRRPR